MEHYPQKDFQLADFLVELRTRMKKTQGWVAEQMDVSSKTVSCWETGAKPIHPSRLPLLIQRFLDAGAFQPGKEYEEAEQLWNLAANVARRACEPFNVAWFTTLLQQHHQAKSAYQVALPIKKDIPIDVPGRFFGRDEECSTLGTWILDQQARCIIITGLGGIGKTALAAKLVEQVEQHFHFILWRSLQNAPSVEDIVTDCTHFLAEPSAEQEKSLPFLLELLRQRRCLLILDNLETILSDDPGTIGSYKLGYDGYSSLVRFFAENNTSSCLLLTSREPLREIRLLEGQKVHTLQLKSLDVQASCSMLRDKNLSGEPETWQQLVARYAGNPLALKIVAEEIRVLFNGEIADFLQHHYVMFQDIRGLLGQQFERLPRDAQAVLHWLAIEREAVSLQTLEEDFIFQPSTPLIETLSLLAQRNLIEVQRKGVFTLQPVVLEYVTERLIDAFCDEIILSDTTKSVRRYALIKTQAKDYVRQSQVHLLVLPILNRLFAHFQSARRLRQHLESIIANMQASPLDEQEGYAAGNILNLLILHTNGNIQGLDASNLFIRQGYFRQVFAQGTNFSHSVFSDTVWRDSFDVLSALALTPGGHIVGGSFGGKIRLWDAESGKPLLFMQAHDRMVWSLAVHPTNPSLLASCGYDGLVKIWDISSGECLSVLHGHVGWVYTVIWFPDGSLLASSGADETIRIWDTGRQQCVSTFQCHQPVQSVAISPDGHLLVSGGETGELAVWSIDEHHCIATIAAHEEAIMSLAFHPTGTFLASAGEDRVVMLWDSSTLQCLDVLHGHEERVWSLAFLNNDILVTHSLDSIRIWHIASVPPGKEMTCCLRTIHESSRIWSSAICANNRLLVYGTHECAVKTWRIEKEGSVVQLRSLQGYSHLISACAFSHSGSLVTGNDVGELSFWQTNTGQCIRHFQGHLGRIHSIVLSPDENILASGGDEGTIRLWNTHTGREIRSFEHHQGEIWSLTFNPQGTLLASSGIDCQVLVWNVETGQNLYSFTTANWIWSLAWSPDGTLLAGGGFTGDIHVWEFPGQHVYKLPSYGPIISLSFGEHLRSSSPVETIIWRGIDGDGERLLSPIEAQGDMNWLGSIAFQPHGSLLAIARGQVVQISDVESGAIVHILRFHASLVWSISWSSDGYFLASGDHDGITAIWDIATGRCIRTLRDERPYENMNIAHVQGISNTQKKALLFLGAYE